VPGGRTGHDRRKRVVPGVPPAAARAARRAGRPRPSVKERARTAAGGN
jgi:hypothetical protein